MANENITQFFDAAMTDKTLAENISALAAENGYNFTAAELLELVKPGPSSTTTRRVYREVSGHFSLGVPFLATVHIAKGIVS